jgi:hypothetical protein
MSLRSILFGEDLSSLEMPCEFDAKIERRTHNDVLQFDARVKGYFTGKSGRPEFVAEQIVLHGLPDMNIRQFCFGEIKAVKRYALSVELPRVIAKKLR